MTKVIPIIEKLDHLQNNEIPQDHEMVFQLVKVGDTDSIIEFSVDELSDTYISGYASLPVAWNTTGVCEATRFVDISMKWDGCSHLNMLHTGEGINIADGYYHVCGGDYFILHAKVYAFLYEILCHTLSDTSPMKDMLTEDLDTFRSYELLRGHEIIVIVREKDTVLLV